MGGQKQRKSALGSIRKSHLSRSLQFLQTGGNDHRAAHQCMWFGWFCMQIRAFCYWVYIHMQKEDIFLDKSAESTPENLASKWIWKKKKSIFFQILYLNYVIFNQRLNVVTFSEPLLLCCWRPYIQKKKKKRLQHVCNLVLNLSAQSLVKD